MSLLADGIIGGVGGVLVFLPNILLLFLAIAVLEDTGYMARAAFLLDRVMHKIGLHGKSFIPMLTGFGCSVPAIMATRTLDTRRDRMVTMLVVPLMSCGARLPIYLLIIPAFFPQAWRAPLVWCIYITGIALAIVCAKLLRSTLFKGAAQPFVMELPPYRMPTLRGLLTHMWHRGWLYLKKAGTIILGVSIILWAMTTFPRKIQFDRNYDAEAAGARSVFMASVGDLNSQLHLPKGSAVIAKAIEAELDAAAEQENYWEHQRGFDEAEQKKDASIKELTKGAGGETLAAFLDIRRAVKTARTNIDQAVERGKTKEGTPKYAALVETRDAAMGQARKTNPRVYEAVIQYLDQVKAPFVRTIREIKHTQQAEELAHSMAGRIGRGMEGAIKPLGFDWKIGTALIGAFGAKEIFVAQLGIVYSVGGADEESEALRDRLRENYTPLQGICIMLFCLISAPCMATIAITKKESNSWGWAMFQLAGLTALAYVVTLGVFQVGSLLV
jgi:ferrous iron transport protein B